VRRRARKDFPSHPRSADVPSAGTEYSSTLRIPGGSAFRGTTASLQVESPTHAPALLIDGPETASGRASRCTHVPASSLSPPRRVPHGDGLLGLAYSRSATSALRQTNRSRVFEVSGRPTTLKTRQTTQRQNPYPLILVRPQASVAHRRGSAGPSICRWKECNSSVPPSSNVSRLLGPDNAAPVANVSAPSFLRRSASRRRRRRPDQNRVAATTSSKPSERSIPEAP